MVVAITGPHSSISDLDVLAPLWRNLHLHHLTVATYRPLVSDPDESWSRRRTWYAQLVDEGGGYFLAEEGGENVGYAFFRLLPGPDDTFDAPGGIIELVTLVLQERVRRRGIGIRLMDAVENEARTRRVDMLQVAVMSGNEAAERFYRRSGFSMGEVVLYRKLNVEDGES
jgi:ribosomal protein S18 acetylase RimI-like enzyme